MMAARPLGAWLTVGLFTLTLLAIVGCGLFQTKSVPAAESEIDQSLLWFPIDTETVFTVRGPFTFEEKDLSSTPELTFIERLRNSYSFFFLPSEAPNSAHPLAGANVRLMVLGSRKYKSPAGLGLGPFEGGHIIWLGRDASTSGDAIEKKLAALADKTIYVRERTIYVFQRKLEQDIWTFYVARPKPDVFVSATHEGYLQGMLARMDEHPSQKALPPDLPMWRLVDQEADFWALRSFDRAGATTDPSSPFGRKKPCSVPDEQAIGLVFSHRASEGNRVRAYYLSGSERALEIAQKGWTISHGDMIPSVRELRRGVIEIAANLDTEESKLSFSLLVLVRMGHCVYI